MTEPTTPPVQAAPPSEDAEDVAQLRDRWQRALAEVENTRKWADRRAAEQRQAERLAVSAAWLPVLDHLDLALQHAAADPASIVSGVEQVQEQARRVLSLLGFEPIGVIGEPFDPQRHEAAEVVRDADIPPGRVARVLRPGYAKGDRLLRPAVVAVNGPPEHQTNQYVDRPADQDAEQPAGRNGGPDGG